MSKRTPTHLLLAAALTLAACAPHAAPAPAAIATSAPLTLDLRALFAPRALLAARGVPRQARITISGPDGATLNELTHDLAAAGDLVALGGIRTGERMLVTLTGLDADEVPIPGQVHHAIGAIGPGPTTMPISPMTTAAGLVVAALIAEDKRVGTSVATRLDYAALDRAIPRFARELRASSPGLLDAKAIALEIHAANGAVPVPRAAHLAKAGRLVLAPSAWPPGATGTVTLDDPGSQPTPVEGKPAVMAGVAPGTWTLTLTPDQAGLAPFTTRVTVGAGADVRAAIGFGAPEAQPRLAAPLGATAAGVLTLPNGTQVLAMAGGSTLGAPGAGAVPAAQVVRLPAVAGVPALPHTPPVAAPAAAVADGLLYWFGGMGQAGASSEAWAYDASGLGRVVARAPVPAGTGLLGASAGAVGDRVYVTGGLRADGTPSAATAAYDVAANAWVVTGSPAVTPHRTCMAGAVVGGTWYLFGGFGDAGLAAAQPGGPIQPVAVTSAWKPGFEDGFRSLAAIPTPRAAAMAVAVAGEIWVLGGVTRDGALTGAVEVYDPATDAWSLRPPLQRPRAYGAAGLLNGKIVVAGGLLGADPAADLPVDDVEAYTP